MTPDYDTVLEGILYTAHYGEMLTRLRRDYAGRSFFYFMDVPFEENHAQARDEAPGRRVWRHRR